MGASSTSVARAAAAVCIAVLAALAAPAAAQPAEPVAVSDRFNAATELLSEERWAEAVEAFVAVANTAPDSDLAADALFTAARTLEEQLADPARAVALYERLLADYPDSRTARAARRRADTLRDSLGPRGGGEAPLARMLDIQHRRHERGDDASIRRMEQLLAEHPAWDGRDRALLWLAETQADAGHLAAAADTFDTLLAADPDEAIAFEAYRGAGGVAARRAEFDRARDYYEQAPVAGDPARRRDIDQALAQLGVERARHRAYLASFGLLAAALVFFLVSLRLGAGSARRAAAELARPPVELVYMVPVAALLVASAWTGNHAIAWAVLMVTCGGLVVAYLSGVGLRASPPTRWRPIAHAVAALVAVAALSYITVHRERLIDLLIETLRFGPEV